jgi:hypothetical protein
MLSNIDITQLELVIVIERLVLIHKQIKINLLVRDAVRGGEGVICRDESGTTDVTKSSCGALELERNLPRPVVWGSILSPNYLVEECSCKNCEKDQLLSEHNISSGESQGLLLLFILCSFALGNLTL